MHGTGLTLVKWHTFVASATEQGKVVGVSNGLEWNAGLRTVGKKDKGQGRQG